MLRGGQRVIFFHSTNEFLDELGNAGGIFAEGPRVDNGIVGIIVHVGVRRVDPLNPHGASLQRRHLTHGVSVAWISRRGESHGSRKRCAFIQTHSGAAFKISADQ